MPRNNQYTAETLLNRLLDRFEAPLARSRDITQTIDYTLVGGPAAQDEFHRVLRDAERASGIALEQDRLGRFTGEFARVRLVDPDQLYRFLVRAPATATAETAHQAILSAIPEILADAFFQDIEQEAIAAWKSNKTFLGLSVGEINTFLTIIRLVHGIVNLSGRDIDHRTFSRRTVKDSKALERMEGRVAQLLRRRDPSLAGEEPREVLEASGIVRRAHLLQVKGPLRLSSDALNIHGTGDAFIGLPWLSVRQASLAHGVDYVMTVENPTSFWRYSTEIDGNYLALLTDGFPARDVLSSMVHLVRHALLLAPETPVYHWGDIDAGGLRIAAHLEDAFGTRVQLHQMEPKLARAFGSPLQSRKGLEKLAKRSGEIGQLALWLRSEEAKMLEQEELDPMPPILAAGRLLSS
ncbi:Wadjet anti-phage system protein JetD domain-containing protein [Bradyrhizobium pachyrhizi]|uniref:Wadjet anti-phage system protein JetD domain-containing protein n=1 Tax=Bradyrhizobium pachyrhizi TaxID=280333 RepID=UPI003D35DF7F